METAVSLSAIADAKGMSSLDIAEITGKLHAHVMRDIRKLLEQGLDESNFGLKLRVNDLGEGRKREDPYYHLTPKGVLILASGYNALLREKIINRLEELEKRGTSQVPQSFSEALLLAAQQQQQIEHQQQMLEAQSATIEKKDSEIQVLSSTITEMKPKTTYYDKILASKDTVPVSLIAQDYGYSAKAFNILLRNYGVQHKVGQTWVLYAKHLPCGYVQSKVFTYGRADGTQGSRLNTEWTQKGRLFLYELLKGKGILPTIEKPQQEVSHQ